MAENKHYANIKIKELDNSEVEITGEISVEKLSECKAKALKKISKEAEMPGFRKGHVPTNVVEKKIGGMAILDEAAEIAISEVYPHIVIDNKIDVIGRPEISITKLADGNPIEFKIKTAVMPKITLGDYKKIAKKIVAKEDKLEVTEKDIEDVILQIRRNKAHADLHEKEGHSHDDHNHPEIKDEDLPKFDDAYVQSLGGFKSVEEVKTKIKENLIEERTIRNKEKKRMEMAEEIISTSKMSVPEIVIKSELQKMLAQFKDDIAQAGVSYDEYLKHIKKSEEDLFKDWRNDAEKKAKMQLILNKIATDEKLEADKEKVEKEVEALMKVYTGADRERATIYVETMLTNEAVFKFLEEQK